MSFHVSNLENLFVFIVVIIAASHGRIQRFHAHHTDEMNKYLLLEHYINGSQ